VSVLPVGGILLSGLLTRLLVAGRSPLRVPTWTIALARDPLESIDRRQPTPRDRGRATG
jgi:hypothetical protein